MAITLSDVEDGILAAIRGDEVLAAALKTIESFQGQNLQAIEDELAHTPHRFPGVFVVFVGADYKPLTQFEEEADFTFALLAVAQSLRGNQAARRGTSGSMGTYSILNELRRLLIGNTLNLTEVLPMWLHREDAVHNSKALSIYEARYIMHGAIILQGS
jgi:phage gp37-like protein